MVTVLYWFYDVCWEIYLGVDSTKWGTFRFLLAGKMKQMQSNVFQGESIVLPLQTLPTRWMVMQARKIHVF